MMAQAQLVGGSTPRTQKEEDALIGYDGTVVTAHEVMDTESTDSGQLMGGLADMNLATSDSEAGTGRAPPPTSGCEPQQYNGVPLPHAVRDADSTVALLQCWIDNEYICPYPRCGFLPTGCRRDGKVMRPDRWSDFTDHWFVNHMDPSLVLACKLANCKTKVRTFNSCKAMSAHLKTHFDHNTDSKVIQESLQAALDKFNSEVGQEANYQTIKNRVIFPGTHLSYKKLTKAPAATGTPPAAASSTAASTSATEPSEGAAAAKQPVGQKTSSTSSSRKSRSEATSSTHKREASMSITRTPKRPKMESIDRLNMRYGAKQLPRAAIVEVTAAMGSIRDNFNVKVGEVITTATSKMIKADHATDVVCKEINEVREACNNHIETLNTMCYGFAGWQKQLGNVPAPVAPPMQLVDHSVMDESRRCVAAETRLSKTLRDLTDTRKQLKTAEDEVTRLRSCATQAGPNTAAATEPASSGRTLGGSSTELNRPTTRREIDLLCSQLSNLWAFTQGFR